MFKFWENGKILDLGIVKNLNEKWIISRQLPDSPSPQQGASDLISGRTGLYVYLFFPNLFLSQISIISPQTDRDAPLSPIIIYKFSKLISIHFL